MLGIHSSVFLDLLVSGLPRILSCVSEDRLCHRVNQLSKIARIRGGL